MIGIFFIAFVVYVKRQWLGNSKLNNGMKIEDAWGSHKEKLFFIINVRGEKIFNCIRYWQHNISCKIRPKRYHKPWKFKLTRKKSKTANKPWKTKLRPCSNFTGNKLYAFIKWSRAQTESKSQVEKYIEELEVLNIANDSTGKRRRWTFKRR